MTVVLLQPIVRAADLWTRQSLPHHATWP